MSRKKIKKRTRKPKTSDPAQAKLKRIVGGMAGRGPQQRWSETAKQSFSDTFNRNMEQIRRSRQWLFDRLRSSPQILEVNIRQTPSNRPTLAVRSPGGEWRLMHSEQDPLAEAAKHVETIKLAEADYLIILGFGLGYHVMEAISRIPSDCPVFIIEHSADIFKAALHVFDFTTILRSPNVKIFVGTDLHETMPALQEDFRSFRYHNIKVVIHPPSAALFPRYKEVMDNFYRVLKIVQINVNTLRFFSRVWLTNNLLNLPAIIESPGVISLFNQFTKRPAILVSAGPSLDKNIDSLRQAQGKAVILAVDTSLRPLLAHGIRPDFVLAIDAQQITYRHFVGLETSDIFLAGVTRLPPNVLELFKGRQFLASDLNNRVWPSIQPYFERLGVLGSGSTVAVLGFDLARNMGCDPIIFVGQDFSYSFERAYAEGTMVANDMVSQLGTHSTMETLTKARKATQRILDTLDIAGREPLVDIHGLPTQMSEAMQGWLTWFTLEIKRTKAKCINASEAGILTEGVEIMPLDEAIYRYCTTPIQTRRIAQSKLSKAAGNDRGAVLASLGKIKEELLQVKKRAEAIEEGEASGPEQMAWFLDKKGQGQVLEVLVGLIDWYKQRHADEAYGDALRTEARATAWACNFAIDLISRSEALLRPGRQ